MNTPKTAIAGLLQARITRRSLLAAALPAAGVSLAWAGEKSGDEGAYKLGGSWIAVEEGTGLIMNELITPLDPAGKTATLRFETVAYGPALAALLGAVGADILTAFVGHMSMTGRDTAKGLEVGYVVASGTTPTIIGVMQISNRFKFTDPDTMISEYVSALYPPSPDGLPHGTPILGPVSGAPVTNKRVPLL